jgi:hypothetical protein
MFAEATLLSSGKPAKSPKATLIVHLRSGEI